MIERRHLNSLRLLHLKGCSLAIPIEVGPEYWEDMHRELEERLIRKRREEAQK